MSNFFTMKSKTKVQLWFIFIDKAEIEIDKIRLGGVRISLRLTYCK